MTKKTKVVVKDELGNEISAGDIIMFIEQRSGMNGYKRASFGKSCVVKITDKSLMLSPVKMSLGEYKQFHKTDVVRDDAINDFETVSITAPDNKQIKTSSRKLLDYRTTTFFKVGHCDGPTLLEII